MIIKYTTFSALLISVAISAPAANSEERNESLVLSVENDVFTGSDSNYTNGISINWSTDSLSKYEPGSFVGGVANLLDFAPGFDSDGEDDHLLFSLIHEMNTPSDITIVDPPLTEQPYSGILLLGTSLYSDRGDWQQTWNLRVGAVGPITQADHLQRAYHQWSGADEPRGWSTQLPNEPIFNIGYVRSDNWFESQLAGDYDLRLSSIANVEAGTYATALGLGSVVEIGKDLNQTVTSSSLGGGIGSFVGVGAEPTQSLEVSGFAGVIGYAVGHYLPIDGNVFRDSRSINDREDLVAQFGTGISARYGNFIGSFAVTFATNPNDRDDTLDVGILSVGWVF